MAQGSLSAGGHEEVEAHFSPEGGEVARCCDELDRVLVVARLALSALKESERWADLERFTAAHDEAVELLDWAQTLGEPRARELEAMVDAQWAEFEAFLADDERLSQQWIAALKARETVPDRADSPSSDA
jgi:hypothetical protein